MYYACNQFKERVYIKDSKDQDTYTCPICSSKLIRKIGNVKASHFAHKKSNCDKWYTGRMSEWHKKMQSYFPAENCEVRINSDKENNVFHIADVFIKGKERNIIIEFQHSPITSKEFEERNNFYSYNNTKKDKNGNKIPNDVIWVFDYRNKRIFTVLSDNLNDFHLEEACGNNMCKDFKNDENFYRRIFNQRCIKYQEDDLTQVSIPLDKAKYVKIKWKNPSKIFYDLPSNIFIFFNIYQRRFIYNTYKYKNEYISTTQEKFQFLNEICSHTKLSDIMSEFLFFISDNEKLNYPDCMVGEYRRYEDFFQNVMKYKEEENK